MKPQPTESVSHYTETWPKCDSKLPVLLQIHRTFGFIYAHGDGRIRCWLPKSYRGEITQNMLDTIAKLLNNKP